MGFDPDAFWRQTPASFDAAMRGAGDRLAREGERDLALAHTTATFTRAKVLHPLTRYLSLRERKAQLGTADMLARLKRIAAATASLEG